MFTKLALLALFAALTLTACGGTDEEQVIRIGLTIDESNPTAGEEASRALAHALSEFIHMPVEPVLDISYLIGTEAMRGGHLDIMLVSPFNYIHTSRVVDVELLVTLPFGQDTLNNGAFIVRADRDDIQSIEDLRGKTIGFVSATSSTGYIFPKYYLVTQLGLSPDLIMHAGYFFDTATFSGGHEAGVFGVQMGDFDVAAIGEMFLGNMENHGLIDTNDFRVIGSTPLVPSPSYIIRSELDDDLIEKIREFFLQFDDPQYFAENWGNGELRFAHPDIEGYAYVRSAMATLGLD